MSTEAKILGTEEAWDNGALGEDEKFAKRVAPERAGQIDEALGMKAVSIRLPVSLIEQFKLLAKLHGVGYQPLMRFALTNFAEGETKLFLNQYLSEIERNKEQSAQEEKAASPKEGRQRADRHREAA